MTFTVILRVTESFPDQISSTHDDERAKCYIAQGDCSRSDKDSKS